MTKNKIQSILLTLLILLSFFLSYNLWSAGEGQSSSENEETSNQAPSSLTDRSMFEVYAPHKAVVHGDSLMTTNQSEIVDVLAPVFENAVFNEVDNVVSVDRDTYFQTMNLSSDNWFEMVYNDLIPIGLLESRFDDLPSDLVNTGINRIAVNLNRPNQIVMYDSLNQMLYEISVDSIDLTELTDYLNNGDPQFVESYAQNINNNIVYLPSERREVDYRNYVVERLPNSLYISHFFPDTSNVDVRSGENETRYIDIMREVRINSNNHVLTYTRQHSDLNEMTVSTRFNESYTHLNNTENWTDAVHYDRYNSENKMMFYRRYLDGIPVFSENGFETTPKVRVLENGLSHLRLPLRVIQTPISLGVLSTKELRSGVEVVEKIESLEGETILNIDDLAVGLGWMESEESNQVIRFEPNWYVRQGENWQSLQSFVEERGGTLNGL